MQVTSNLAIYYTQALQHISVLLEQLEGWTVERRADEIQYFELFSTLGDI